MAEQQAEAGAEKGFLKKPILVLWEARARALACLMLFTKALADPFALKSCVRLLDVEWGLAGERIVLRGDGEPALQALLRELGAKRKGPAAVEVSPPGDHQANGAAEQGVRLAQGYARTLLAAVAQAVGLEDVPESSPLIPYAVRHGAWLYTRYVVRPDGKTAWDELRGKPFRGALAEFGEKVRYLRPEAERGGKLAQKFAVGVFVGREERTGRVLVATPSGLVRADKFLRLPEGEQFDRQAIEGIRGAPWDEAGRRAVGVDEDPLPPLTEDGGDGAAAAPAADKRPYLNRGVLGKHGATPGCPGCKAVLDRNAPSRPHTGPCRARLQGALVRDLEERLARAEEEARAAEQEEEQALGSEEEEQLQEEEPSASEERRAPAPGPVDEREELEEFRRVEEAVSKRAREEQAEPRQLRPREGLADLQAMGSEERRPGGAAAGAAARGGAAGAAPGGGAAGAPGGARGEKRELPRSPGSWIERANVPGSPDKAPRVSAAFRPGAAEEEMAAAGLGLYEGCFGGRFERGASAALTFSVAAVMPTAADQRESALLEAFQGRGLSKPVYDAASGVLLDPGLVRAARAEELGYARKHGVWEKVPRAQALARGKKVIGVKWLDINKGDPGSPAIRSRLVAKELRAFAPWIPQEDLFAATPPTAALNLLLSTMVSRKSRAGQHYKLAFLDVRRAFFYAAATEEVYVELAPEDRVAGQDLVGLLHRSMYGTRSASKNWQLQLGRDLAALGFKQAKSSPCIFWHEELDARLVIHGDDLWLLADEKSLGDLMPRLHATYELKVEGILGPDPGDAKAVRSLNKLIRFVPDVGIEIEADPRHAEIVPGELGLTRGPRRPVSTPGSKADIEANGADPAPIEDASEVTAYRGISARGLYLSADRPELRFATKEAARRMSAPTRGDLSGLKRIGRFLLAKPRLVQTLAFQGEFVAPRVYPGGGEVRAAPAWIYALVDSNWADCRLTRKSTSGGALLHGDHVLATWSVTQSVQALSTGEAELYAVLKGTVEALGLSAVAEELGMVLRAPRVGSDSTAAKGTCSRHGLGKLKHLDLKFLWVQEAVRAKRVIIVKVDGESNFADLMTKHLDVGKMLALLQGAGYEFREGRAPGAPELAEGAVQQRVAMILLGMGTGS